MISITNHIAEPERDNKSIEDIINTIDRLKIEINSLKDEIESNMSSHLKRQPIKEAQIASIREKNSQRKKVFAE